MNRNSNMLVSYNVHSSVNLGYSFPSPDESDIDFSSHQPRDSALLCKKLRLEDLPIPKEPHYTKYPIAKHYNLQPFTNDITENPLYELFTENQKLINLYQLELPFTRKNTECIVSTSKGNLDEETYSSTRGVKRPRYTGDENAFERDEIKEPIASPYKTPIPNKTIFFSSSASAKKKNSSNLLQSTPVSEIGENSNKKPGLLLAKQKHLKMDKAEILNLPIKSSSDKINLIRHDSETDESMEMASDYDHLACHAGNIMRMAVDSTMLGSSYNDSFSPTFNNTFGGNDSILGLHNRKRYNDFFEEDADRSLIESMKSRWNNGLNKLKAKKIDINADELKQAVQAD